MCTGGGPVASALVGKREVRNDPVVITGEQEGLEKKKKKNDY